MSIIVSAYSRLWNRYRTWRRLHTLLSDDPVSATLTRAFHAGGRLAAADAPLAGKNGTA